VSPQRVLDRERTALVVIDFQEAFRTAVGEFDTVARHAGVLVQGARELGLPIVVTEQYPQGLGETVPEVAAHLNGVARHAKTVFSAVRADGFDLEGRDQVVVCGIEAHVCVQQTVQDLIDQGVEVHVAADAVTSRTALDRRLAVEKMERSGAWVTSTEMALFELLGQAGTPEFKAIQKLVL
jgi:nicotinamidase-related amidase